MDGERDVVLAGELAEPLGERVVHPEAALEVDLAGRVAAFEEQLDACSGDSRDGMPGRADADERSHDAIASAVDVIGSRREGDDAPCRLRRRLRRKAHDRRRRLVADRPEPASFGIGLLIQVPWDQANTLHSFTVELLDADGAAVDPRDDEDEEQAVAFGGEFEVGRPPGLKPGTPLDFPVAMNSTPLPLEPGPLRVAADDRRRGARRTGACRSPFVARSGALAPSRVRPTGARTLEACPGRPPVSICSSSTSTSGSPISGARRSTSTTGTSRSSRPSSAPRTARGTATRSPRSRPGALCVEHGYRMPERRAASRPEPRTPRAVCEAAAREPERRARLDSPRGTEGQPGAARHRALGRGGARGLPSVHVDRRWREPVARAQRARGANGARSSSRRRRRAGARRLARRRAALPAAGHRRAATTVGRRAVHGLRARSLQGRPPHRRRRRLQKRRSFVAEPRLDDHEVPVEVRAEAQRGGLTLAPDPRIAMPELGRAALLVTLGLAVYALVAGACAARPRAPPARASAQNALVASFVSTLVAAVVLLAALLRNDFSFDVRRAHDERGAADRVHDLGVLGRAGGVAAPLAARPDRVRRGGGAARTAAGRATSSSGSCPCSRPWRSFFSFLVVVVASPFATQAAPADGAGMTPSLQNPYMLAHPPLLYLGYVGLTVPFAFAIGALLSGRLGRALAHRDAALDALRVGGARDRPAARSALGVRRGRLGRLLRVGSGRERRAHAVARGDGVPALGDDPGEARDAEGLERAARASSPSRSRSSGRSSRARASSTRSTRSRRARSGRGSSRSSC